MRLIDADALKKAINDYAEKRQDVLLWQADIEELIDNAPTVKEMPEKYIIQVKTKEDAQKIKNVWDKNNFGNVIITSDNLDIIPIRPQGEWITTRTMNHDGNPYCSICDEENIIRSNYCPNCGAFMGGKEE